MPTGYTADVISGKVTDLESFAMQLARGMGACISMRDDDFSKPIPERFEPSDYNAKKLEEARAERDRIYAMSDADAQAEADKEYADGIAARDAYLARKVQERDRYLAMIAKVEAWQGAPEGIKEFGLEQLRSGLAFDCREPFTYYREVEQRTGQEWRTTALEAVGQEIERHAVEDAKERARTDGRNAWLAQLRASLAGSVS